MKLQTLCANYLESFYFDLSESTRETIERAFRYFAKAVGNVSVKDLKPKHIQKFKGWLINEQRLKKSSASVTYRAVAPVLKWAVREGEILQDPLRGLSDFKFTKKPPNIYEDWQVEKLLAIANPIQKAAIRLARFYGLRRSEVLNLIYHNIRDDYIYVEPKEMTCETWEWHPKVYEVRSIPIYDTETINTLRRLPGLYPILPETTYRRMLRKQKKGWLKQRERNCPLWNFNRDFNRLQRRAFGKVLINDFHDLRATFCTAGLEAGVPLHVMKELMGHSNIQTTMTYYTVVRQSAKEDARQTLANAYKNGDVTRTEGNRTSINSGQATPPTMGGTEVESVPSCV